MALLDLSLSTSELFRPACPGFDGSDAPDVYNDPKFFI